MDLGFKTFGLDTSIPSIPIISGKVSGNIGVVYDYSIISEDDDGDEISYYVDFGDGFTLKVGPFPSGSSCTVSHSWSKSGTYEVKGSTIALNPMVAKMPFVMNIEAPMNHEFRFDGDMLIFIHYNQQELKLTRLE